MRNDRSEYLPKYSFKRHWLASAYNIALCPHPSILETGVEYGWQAGKPSKFMKVEEFI